jgi:hypothetical protein
MSASGQGEKRAKRPSEESPTGARKAKAIDRPDVHPQGSTAPAQVHDETRLPLAIDRWWVPGRARAQSYWATAAAAEWRAESFRRLVGVRVVRARPPPSNPIGTTA